MNKRTIIFSVIILFSLLSVMLWQSDVIYAQSQDDEQWEVSGKVTEKAELVTIPVLDPEEEGYNNTFGDHELPILYFYAVALDHDGDNKIDFYVGFEGVSLMDTSANNYKTYDAIFNSIGITDIWRLRVPESSPLGWEILYYPDPLYAQVVDKLAAPIPIYYVRLNSYTGCNLVFQIEKGLNATVGNFTTFGKDKPLLPDIPDYPGYNVSIPVFTRSFLLEEQAGTQRASLYSNTLVFITMSFIAFITATKLKKRKLSKQ